MEQARDILCELDIEELADRITSLQAEIRKYRKETGVESLEDAAVGDVEIDRETFQSWRTTHRNPDVAKAALAIGQAKDAVEASHHEPEFAD